MDESFIHKWQSQLKKGTLSFIVLNILKDKEYYGYELIESVRVHTEIEVAEGTLYPLLNRLKKDELVTSKWVEQESGIPRKYYCLTKTGDNILKQMQMYWDGLEASIKKIKQ